MADDPPDILLAPKNLFILNFVPTFCHTSLRAVLILADIVQVFSPGLTITVVKEFFCSLVRIRCSPCMFYRAPVLLGTGNHFPDVFYQSVTVSAVHTVSFFNQVQVGQVVSVDVQVIATAYPWNSIDAETNMLVDGDTQIQESQRNDHSVYDRCR